MSLWGYLTGAKGPSGFGSASTAEQVATAYADQAKGKVVLITGATAGIGLEAARTLAQQGAIVYIGARSEDKAAKAAETIRASAPQADVRPFIADLCSLQSVKTAVDKFLAEDVPLHILINNAGVMATPLEYTKDGLELQWGTNHIAHYYLTTLLLDKLKASAPARVVSLASTAHAYAPREGIKFDNLDAKKGYNASVRYGETKLANILFIRALQERQIPGVNFYSVHPGVILTNLFVHVAGGTLNRLLPRMPFGKTVPQGAATTVFCALSDKAAPGEYHRDCNVDLKGSHRQFRNLELTKKLMEVSENIVREKTAAFA